MKPKTVNQLLDLMGNIPIRNMTPKMGELRQKLIDLKRSQPKGGLIEVENSTIIEMAIRVAMVPSRELIAERAVVFN